MLKRRFSGDAIGDGVDRSKLEWIVILSTVARFEASDGEGVDAVGEDADITGEFADGGDLSARIASNIWFILSNCEFILTWRTRLSLNSAKMSSEELEPISLAKDTAGVATDAADVAVEMVRDRVERSLRDAGAASGPTSLSDSSAISKMVRSEFQNKRLNKISF